MITLDEYKAADRAASIEAARRGFTIHAAIYVTVNIILIAVNVALVPEFYWFPFPLIGWGIGLTNHYVFGVRHIDARVEARQESIERRAMQTHPAS